MTNEEAILHMTLRREELKLSVGDLDEDIEAFDMAIEALEQESCEDAISRQAAIRIAEQGQIQGFEWQFKQLVDLPSVSTEKTGHWKRISIDKYSEHSKYWYRCDRCGKDNLGNTGWCPNCGAKMEEVDE